MLAQAITHHIGTLAPHHAQGLPRHVDVLMQATKLHDGVASVRTLASVASHQAILLEEQARRPDWFAALDLLDLDTADRYTLFSLLKEAPSDYMEGFIYAKILVGMELRQMSGRPGFVADVDDLPTQMCLMQHCHAKLRTKAARSNWIDLYDDMDLMTCALDDLRCMLATAPSRFAGGLCFGLLSFRLHMHWVRNCH